MIDLPADFDRVIASVLRSAPRVAVFAAGGGSSLATWLTGNAAGASRFFVGERFGYSTEEIDRLLGRRVDAYCSEAVALDLAERAFERGTAPLGFGVGITAAFVTNRARQGAERAFVALVGNGPERVVGIRFERDRPWTRSEQESATSLLALREIALRADPSLALDWLLDARSLAPPECSSPLVIGVDGSEHELSRDAIDPENSVVCSGSFNPLHRGHLLMARRAAEQSGRSVVFEIPVANAESGKSVSTLGDARRRARQFAWNSPVVIMPTAPTFAEKAARYGAGISFVVGADTAARICEDRFYGGAEGRVRALESLARDRVRFHVAARRSENGELQSGIERVPDRFRELFVPFEIDERVSSTEIRNSRSSRKHGFAPRR